MRKTLLTTVSVIALGLGSTAFADDATQTDTNTQTQVETDMNADTGTGMDTQTDTGMDTQTELGADADLSVDSDINADSDMTSDMDADIDSNAAAGMTAGAYSADELIDATVVGSNGEEIADVEDLVIDSDNNVVDVLVNVGGFLGLGEKVVALDVDQLDVSHDEDGDTMIVTSLTKEELEGMADYEASDDYRLQSEIDSGTY